MDLESIIESMTRPPAGGWTCTRCSCAIGHPGVCDPCAAIFDRERSQDRIAESVATIPSRFRWASFGSPDLVNRTGAGIPERTQAALAALESQFARSSLIHGKAGKGKTSLACAMMRSLADRGHPWARKMVFARALGLSRARYDEGLGRVPVEIQKAQEAALLVLDDLGQETVGVDVIRDVIHHRHDCELPTIYTSHLDRAGIAAKYGAGTARRITERCARIEL